MTAEEFAELQYEWESIELGNVDTDEVCERQREIQCIMDSTPFALHPDTGEVITLEQLMLI